MNVRLTGAADECAALVALFGDLAEAGVLAYLGEASRPYPNRPPSTHVRVYVDLVPASTGTHGAAQAAGR